MPLPARIVRTRSQLLRAVGVSAALAAFLAASLAGCASGRPSLGGSVVGEPVEVSADHVHSASCGHFRRHQRWYYAPDHAHHAGCGHVFRDGVWVAEEGVE